MSSVMSPQSVILTTAMAVSGAVLLLSLCRHWNFPPTHHDSHSDPQSSDHNSSYPLRSCLYSDGKKREKNKKKRVSFADNVKDEKRETRGEIGKTNRKEQGFGYEEIPEFRRMPGNRAALYHGLLRDRVNRIEYSY